MARKRSFAIHPTPLVQQTPWAFLASSVNSSTTTFLLTQALANPPSDDFDILIGDYNTADPPQPILTPEFARVTAGNAGTSWTVTRASEGPAASAHAAGAAIWLVETPNGHEQSPGVKSATGDMDYLGASGIMTRLPAGADDDYLWYSGGLPITGPILAAHVPDLSASYVTPAALVTVLDDYLQSANLVWGAIGGTLSNQTDLQAALNAKVPTSRTINTLPLSADIALTASDVGALSSTLPGADTQILFNDSGSLGADANLTWDGNTFTVVSHGDSGGAKVTGTASGVGQFPTVVWVGGSAGGFAIDSIYGVYVEPFTLDGGSIDTIWAIEVQDQVANTRVSYGVNVGAIGGGSEANYSFYARDLASALANPYYFWADSRGVYRIREDNVADGSGNPQAVPALYNPRFTKYTPGAVDYERGVQQWVGNVYQIGAEAGGSGVTRALQLIGASVSAVGNLTAANLSGTNTGDQDLSVLVPTSRTVNGHSLSANVSVTASDVGLGSVENAAASALYQPLDGDLSAIAALSTSGFAKRTGVNTWVIDSSTYLTAVTAHALLSATHSDTLAASVVRGDLLYGNSTPAWARLAKPSVLSGLSHDGTDVSWVTATGTGAPVRADGPTLTTPALGVATGTRLTLSPSGAAGLTVTGATETTSQPVISATQTWNASGTTFTGALINITNTASASGSKFLDFQFSGTSQTYFARNGALVQTSLAIIGTGGGATNVNMQLGGGASGLYMVADWTLGWNSSNAGSVNIFGSGTKDLILGRAAAATLQMGADVNGAAIAQKVQAANGITGTDKTGGDLTFASGKGTGAGAVSSLIFQTPAVLASGTTAQTSTTRLTITEGSITIADATNVVVNATTGTKWGTATGQKQSWWGATPVAQQVLATGGGATVDNVITLLQTLGLCKQS